MDSGTKGRNARVSCWVPAGSVVIITDVAHNSTVDVQYMYCNLYIVTRVAAPRVVARARSDRQTGHRFVTPKGRAARLVLLHTFSPVAQKRRNCYSRTLSQNFFFFPATSHTLQL